MLGDHRLLAKMVFYEPSVTIPLIVRPPGGMTGRVVDGPVEQIDVTATIRAIAGAAQVPEAEGQSLLGHVEEGGDGFVREVAHSENFGFGMFVTGRYKLLVWEDGREPVQLFDLLEDPDENRNVVADPGYAEIREQLMTQYVEPFLRKEPVRPGPSLVERLAEAGR
jgi:choline-sulfatase